MISQRLCSNIPDTLLLLPSHRPPPPSLPSPAQHLPTRALLSESKGPPSAFSFFSHTQNKGKQPSDPGGHWSERDRSCLLKRSLSIAAWRLAIGTNEAYHSLIPIPFDLTHFIDSPCAPNEMLNLSPVAAVPCSYCYGDRERGAVEKYHNMEGVQLKKAHPSIPLFPCTALIFAPSLHLMLQTKGYTEKLRKNSEMSFLKMCYASLFPDIILSSVHYTEVQSGQKYLEILWAGNALIFSCEVLIFFFLIMEIFSYTMWILIFVSADSFTYYHFIFGLHLYYKILSCAVFLYIFHPIQ